MITLQKHVNAMSLAVPNASQISIPVLNVTLDCNFYSSIILDSMIIPIKSANVMLQIA